MPCKQPVKARETGRVLAVRAQLQGANEAGADLDCAGVATWPKPDFAADLPLPAILQRICN